MTLNAERLREVLEYSPGTGLFCRLVDSDYHRNKGTVSLGVNSQGYTHIRIDGVKYKAHRLAWLYVYGRWPSKFIDHINSDRADNRIVNLREATNAENAANRGKSRRNSSGFKGVGWHKATGKWIAGICIARRKIYLGVFETPEAAHQAYVVAAQKHLGGFARGS